MQAPLLVLHHELQAALALQPLHVLRLPAHSWSELELLLAVSAKILLQARR